MKKRVLSFITIVMLLSGVFSVLPAMAEDAPAEVLEDFVAGELPANFINTYPTEGNLNINAGEVRATALGNVATLSAVADCNGHASLGLQGFNIDRLFIPALSGTGYTPAFSKGAKVLFSGRMRKAADATQNPRINIVYASEGYGKKYYPDNYPTGSAGVLLSGTEWTDFKTVMTAPEDFGGQYWYFLLGFSNGTKSGAKAEIDMSSLYFGEEIAHDIRLTVDGKTDVEAGAEAIVRADVDIVNQLGDACSTQGTFNWYAMDETRTQIVSSITVVPQEDGLATIHIDASVPAGNYVIAAQSVEHPEMVKSFSVAVGTKDWSDHEPKSVDSWYLNPTMEQNWSGHLDGSPSVSIGAGTVGTTISKTDITNQEELKDRLMGVVFSGMMGNASGTPSKVYPAGTKLAISFKVRNLTPEKMVKMNAGIYSYYELYSITPDEYPTIAYEDCFVVAGSDWNEFQGVITLPSEMSLELFSMDIGFPDGTEEGAMIEIDNASFYLAPYKAYDIKITDNAGTGMLDPGVASSFTADIIDYTGTAMGEIESMDWALLDEEKTARVSGVTFTPDETNATTVYVVVDKTVAPGNYYLAVESTSGETKGWIKSIPVQVLKATIHDYVAGTIPGEVHDIEVVRTDSGAQTIGLTDTAAFSAAVVDINGAPVDAQGFIWFVMDETRKEKVTEEFVVVPSADTVTATVTPKLTTGNGTYYVMAQYTHHEEIVKGVKLIVDKTQSVADGAKLINSGTAERIAAQLADIAVIVEVSSDVQAALAENTGAVKKKASEILAASFEGAAKLPENDMQAVRDAIEQAVVFALYNVNPASVPLYDAEGKFVFAEEMNLAGIDVDGVTLYEVFNTGLSNAGRTEMQKALMTTPATTIGYFMKTIKENIVLYGVKYPDEIGVSYLEDILTAKNLAAAEINAPKYLARADKSITHKTIARTLYTVETLVAALEQESQTGTTGGNFGGGTTGGGSFGGGSGGGGGGGHFAPIETVPTEKEPEETVTPNYPKFSDVSEEHWAYADIYYLRERNIINGVDQEHFDPDGNITREQFAKILCTALNMETADKETGFEDVDENAWYAPFIAAAFDKGIITGMSSDNFGVGQAITRQDLCTMISRAIESEKPSNTAIGFADEDQISKYAKEGVALLKELGIVNGYEDGAFHPQNFCTRAETAKIICELLATMEVSGK